MGIPLAFITRASALDNARLKAQATRRQALLAHFMQEGLTQGGALPEGSLHQAPLTALSDMDGLHETDFIRVPVGLQRRRLHQGAHGKVSQQQARAFLLDPLGRLRAQGGDQPDRRDSASPCGDRFSLVLKHACSHYLPATTSAVLLDLDQGAAILQAYPRLFLFDTLQASHYVGLHASCGEQDLASRRSRHRITATYQDPAAAPASGAHCEFLLVAPP